MKQQQLFFAIVLSFFQFMASDYPFGILKRFLDE
jgi:hypothetical protein